MKLLLAAATATLAAAEHPVVNVINMLVDLKSKGKKDGEEEGFTFQKFTYWCQKEQKRLKREIKESEDKIVELEDKENSLDASVKALDGEIHELEQTLDKLTKEKTEADSTRESESGNYATEQSNFEETMSAISGALQQLRDAKCDSTAALAEMRSTVQKAAELSASGLRKSDAHVIHSFMQQAPVDARSGATHIMRCDPKRMAPVIELLKKLTSDFKTQKLESTKGENNRKNAHERENILLENEIKATGLLKDETIKHREEDAAELETTRGNLGEERTLLGDNQKELQTTTAECNTKTEEYNQRVKVRVAEQNALAQAVEILSKVADVRNPLNDVVKRREVFFLQLSRNSDPKMKVVSLIKDAARKNHSQMLARFAQKIAMAEGPFDQIRNMIQKMVFRLNKEQTDEDNHKMWCDTEISKSEDAKKTKEEAREALTDKIASHTAKIAELKEAVTEALRQVKETNEHIATETELRNANKAENERTIKESAQAQSAISQAMGVLEEFYKGTGAVPDSFLQQEPVATYAGGVFTNTDGSQAVLDTLKKAMSQYSELEAEARAAEATDQQNFDEDMTASMTKRDGKQKEADLKSARKVNLTQEKESLQAEKKRVANALEAVEIYLKDLQPACVEGDSTYETRKSERAAEIEALRQAENTLKEAFSGVGKSFLSRNL